LADVSTSRAEAGPQIGAEDIDLQIDQVAANAAAVLAAVGARPDQVVRSVIYVVSDDSSVLAAAWCQLTLSVIGSASTTAGTLLGVTRLGFSGQLVESTSPPHFDHTPPGANRTATEPAGWMRGEIAKGVVTDGRNDS
jgi:hypothetical protein